MTTRGRALLLVLALGLATGVVAWQGFAEVQAALAEAGWGLLLLAPVGFGSVIVATFAWRALFPQDARPALHLIGFGNWVGQSANWLLPVAQVGGELARARLLASRVAPEARAEVFATTVADKTLQAFAQALIALLGVGLLASQRGGAELIPAAAGFSLVLIAMLLIFVRLQRGGLFGRLAARAARSSKGRQLQAWLGSAERLDERLQAVYARRSGLAASLLLRIASRLCFAVETWLALRLVGHPVSILDALLLDALGQTVRAAAFLIPGAYGVQEGGYALLGELIGVPGEAAVSVSLAKRGRELLVGLPALLLWQLAELRSAGELARMRGSERRGEPMFRRILIANRGEVVMRVKRTAERLGIEVVTVHSTADAETPYAREGSSVCLGPAASSKSYLDGEAILQAARQTGCSAIHPGWGFLSENAEFAALCRAHGLQFIGPSPEVMDLMSKKTPAKRRMAELGVAGVPGSDGVLDEPEDAVAEAERIGFPVILKAESGGGGRGMRICRDAGQLASAASEAAREAAAAFSDPSLYLEKYIESGRHIEVQVLVDRGGRAVTLGERECSVQRKHQKLIEEAPSPALDAEARAALEARVAEACSRLGYEGAGTVEMLRDASGELYFIEMNTRLQVEHPVTEMITGVDLVEQQLAVAAGRPLPEGLGAERAGHAIECRINAEDPSEDFKPCPGKVTRFVLPEGEGVRVDTYMEEGAEVPPFYDSLIAKVIVHAPTRGEAIAKMRAALEAFVVEGVKTTIPFHLEVLASEAFVSGDYDTRLVAQLSRAD